MGDAPTPHDPLPDDEKSSEIGSTDSSSWNGSQEDLMKSISERSNCMRWLHTQCSIYFENVNFYLTIPNVVISTLNGGFTMSLTALFPNGDQQKAATTIIGLISIFSAMLITMNQYIKSQQMMESHRSAGLGCGKLHRMISNELALRRDQRTNALDYLKYVRMEQDRLESTSPSILPHIIARFNIQFKDKDIEKPEITGDLDTVEINIKHRKGHDYSPTDNESIEPTPNSILKVISGLSTTVRHKILGPSRNVITPREEYKTTREENKPIRRLPHSFIISHKHDEPVTPPNIPTASMDSIEVVPKN